MEHFSPHSRVWIYQADRLLSEDESLSCEEQLVAFARQWSSHGQALEARAAVLHRLFLVFSVNANSAASGCSIDSSVALVRHLGEQFKLDFFNRLTLACECESGLELIHRNDLESALERGILHAQTLVFDNTVQSLEEWKKSWKRPFSESWAAQFAGTATR